MIINFKLQLILLLGSLIFFFIVCRSTIKRKIEIRYSLLWILLSIAFIIISLFPNIVIVLNNLVGIDEPIHFIFVSIMAFILLFIFIYNYTISEIINANRILVQEIGILKNRVQKIEDNREEKDI